MKDKFLYYYYFALILVLALYTNMSHSPNMLIRLGYLAALVLPLVTKKELFPAVIICALGISKNTFAYPLIPTDMYYYVIIALGFAILSLYRRSFHTEINPLFLVAFIYVLLNDLVLQGELSRMVTFFFICILFYFCMENATEDSSIHLMSLFFVLITFAISYWVLFCPEALTNSYNGMRDEEMEMEMEQLSWTDPNYLSVALGAGLVVAVKDLIKGDNKPLYVVFLVLTVFISILAILQLASRGIVLATVLSVVALFTLLKSKNWVKVIVVIVALLLVEFLYTNQYMEFVLARFEADDGTGNRRTEIWFSKIEDFFYNGNVFDLIFGVGRSRCIELGNYYASGRSTHNDFLSILTSFGFVGIAIFFSVIAYPLRVCKKSDRGQIIALLVYLLMCGMTIEPMASGNFVYWGFFFYIIVLARQSQAMRLAEEKEDESQD